MMISVMRIKVILNFGLSTLAIYIYICKTYVYVLILCEGQICFCLPGGLLVEFENQALCVDFNNGVRRGSRLL